MRIAFVRAVLGLVAAGELVWSLIFYLRPETALATLGRSVVDPVICRQYPLYLASAALAYALGATDPERYRGIVWACVAQRCVEVAAALFDWRAHAISTSTMLWLGALEIAVALALVVPMLQSRVALARGAVSAGGRPRLDPRDRGLVRLLRGFGGLEVFWFLASTIFVQLGARLLNWKLQDPYTTQQQGIALLVIGLASFIAASDVARYRLFVWVPVASQLIGVVNAFNEIHLGSISWGVAAIQWTVELAIVGSFAYFSRHHFRSAKRTEALAD